MMQDSNALPEDLSEVFESGNPVEEILPDGTRRKSCTVANGMELIKEEGPPKEETEEENKEEVLSDGTVHTVHKVRRHSMKKTKMSWRSIDGQELIIDESCEEVPGTVREDLIERFAGPPKVVEENKKVEETADDGKKVEKNVVMKRMVSLVRTHQESFDDTKGRQVERFESEEIVPGTESAFVAGQDSTSSSSGSSSVSSSDDEDNGKETKAEDNVETTLEAVQEKLSEASVKDKSPEDPQQGGDHVDSGDQGDDEDIQTHRLMMKKEIHKKTTYGADGHEETTIREDSQVQQDDDPPEELRDSMQEIINQFMESDPEPPKLSETEHFEDEV